MSIFLHVCTCDCSNHIGFPKPCFAPTMSFMKNSMLNKKCFPEKTHNVGFLVWGSYVIFKKLFIFTYF